MDHDPHPGPVAPSRLVTVLCLVAIAVAGVGLLVGFAPASSAWTQSTPPHSTQESTTALPAVAYLQMNGKARGPNRNYVTDVATLQSGFPAITDPVVNTPADKAATLALRASRRAYAGAPPTIPHPVDANLVGSCLGCHGSGVKVGDTIAPKISHVHLTNCTQCHAQAGTPGLGPEFPVANTFVGLESPTQGSRAWPGAPPVMPHSTRMREDCTSCHGTTGRAGIRSTHPWRANCLQCHATGAALNQTDLTNAIGLPPGPPVKPVP